MKSKFRHSKAENDWADISVGLIPSGVHAPRPVERGYS